MRCPACAGLDDKVVDSRMSEDGSVIRRRRECLTCGRRFTTFERLDEVALQVVKRSGHREPFQQAKIVAGMRAAAKGRPLVDEQFATVAADIEERLRASGVTEVSTDDIGLAVLDALRRLDEVTYLRFASVYKNFADLTDFQREVRLLAKSTVPKTRD